LISWHEPLVHNCYQLCIHIHTEICQSHCTRCYIKTWHRAPSTKAINCCFENGNVHVKAEIILLATKTRMWRSTAALAGSPSSFLPPHSHSPLYLVRRHRCSIDYCFMTLRWSIVFVLPLTAILLWSHIWDHSPHHFVVFGHISVNFGRNIKVDSVLDRRMWRINLAQW
jgi:hypothetical protein